MTPDDLRGYVSLLPYWAFGLALAGSFYKGTVWLGGHFSPGFQKDLTNWLKGNNDRTWATQFCTFFDTLFGPRHLSLKRLMRSAIASVLAVVVLYVLFAHVLGVLGTRALGSMDLWQALGALVMVNIVADYLSLIETRWLLERFRRVRSVAGQAALLAADLVFTGAIVFLLLAAYGYFVLGAVPRPIEVLALFSVYSIFFYSTFLTSVWAWLYCASSWFVRLFTHLRLGRIFDVDKNPVKQIALVGAGLIVLGSLALGPLVRAEEGGVGARLDRWLCEWDLDACFLAARANRELGDLGSTVTFMQMACQDDRDQGNCADRLEVFFRDEPGTVVTIWERACRGGWAWGCGMAGYFYHTGKGVAEDFGQAVALYRQACDGGNVRGCANLGWMYETGRGVTEDFDQAVALYRQACEGGDDVGCANLGVMYRDGRGVAEDVVQAVALFRQGCDGGNVRGCTNLGVMYGTGRGVAEDFDQAVALYRQGCDGGEAGGCAYLGWRYETGRGVAEDFDQAVALYRQGCEGGHAGGCTNLGWMYETGQGVTMDMQQAAAHYRQGCERGEARGCAYLGDMYEYGKGVTLDMERAADLYRQGCDGGNDWGCEALDRLSGE